MATDSPSPAPAAHPGPGARQRAEHFIPLALHEVERLTTERATGSGNPAAAEVARLISLALRRQTDAQADALKRVYQRARPDDDGQVRRLDAADAGASRDADIRELCTLLDAVLTRANYHHATDRDLADAFASEAIAQVRIETDLSDFATLMIYTRGRHRRTETIRSFFGLRKRRIQMDVFDRVFLFARFKDLAAVARRGAAAAPLHSPLQLKLARGIPAADLEMLLPNSKITMRKLDQAFIVLPALVSVIGIAGKVLLSLTALIAFGKFLAGLEENPPAVSGGWAVVGAGALGLLSIAAGAYTKYQNRRLKYMKSYSDTLYFQTLDNEAGAFLRILDEAYEEEAKEAMLAYVVLSEGPCEEPALDRAIEAWLGARIGTAFDFEVDDALHKLERLGIARREGQAWHALPPAQARALLLQQLSAAAEAHAARG